MSTAERFQRLVRNFSEVAIGPLPKAPAPTRQESAVSAMATLIGNEDTYETIMEWLSVHQDAAETAQTGALRDHPLMCHFTGKITSFRELKAQLTSLRQPGSPGRA